MAQRNPKRKRLHAAAMPSSVEPMLPTPIKLPFSDPQWLFEIKLDGYRALCFLKDGKVRFISRKTRPDTAHQHMKRECRYKQANTMQTLTLVNEAYLRLIDQRNVRWQNRAQFFSIASRLMRRILVDHARAHHYAKRGGGTVKVSLDEAALVSQQRVAELMALDDALTNLAAIDQRKSQVVELRFFGGMSVEETAAALGVAAVPVKRDWSTAKAWLYRAMKE